MNLTICEVNENVDLKICEANYGKNRGVAVEKLQLGKNQTQCTDLPVLGLGRNLSCKVGWGAVRLAGAAARLS